MGIFGHFSYPWDPGDIRRDPDGGPFQLLWTDPYTLPRARAYNDLPEHPILLKTRSSGGPGYPRFERVFDLSAGTSVH